MHDDGRLSQEVSDIEESENERTAGSVKLPEDIGDKETWARHGLKRAACWSVSQFYPVSGLYAK